MKGTSIRLAQECVRLSATIEARVSSYLTRVVNAVSITGAPTERAQIVERASIGSAQKGMRVINRGGVGIACHLASMVDRSGGAKVVRTEGAEISKCAAVLIG